MQIEPTAEAPVVPAPVEEAPLAPVKSLAGKGGFRELLRNTLRLREGKIGLALVLFVLAVAFLGPFFAPHDPSTVIAAPYTSPNSNALLGTDNLGRDVLSRFLHGGAVLLLLAFAATVVGVGTGTLLGLIAGYRRGFRGEFIMRSLDVVLSFPSLLLALLFLSLLGPKLWLIVLVVAASHTPYVARVVESSTLGLTGRGFVRYTEMIGLSRWRIMSGEILPNILAPLTVQFGLRLTYSIALIASLAYLGFGRPAPAVDWGMMINENQANIVASPLPVVVPIIAIAIITIGSNLLTDAFGRAGGIDLGREGEA
ncbi:MAG: ABC transporter permease [Actinobacteria bacterium]|nr:ABC transporter permease [Actinomycetota bacterium]